MRAHNRPDTGTPANEVALAEASAFAQRIGERWWSDFEGRLIGVYRLGSLAHGGFSRRYSDIDVAVIAVEPLVSAELDRMRELATDASSELAGRLSIFWADRFFRAGRFPPLDRVDYLDHGAAIVERERVRPERPPLLEIRQSLRGAVERWSQQIRYYSELPALGASDHKPYLRSLLYPARLLYSWTTGAMASNDHAVEFVRRHSIPDLDVDLIERALQCRRENGDLDRLFPERSKLEHQYSVCATVISRS